MAITEYKEQVAVEKSARSFAAITSEANQLARILQQEFEVRVNAKTFYSSLQPSTVNALGNLMGKTITVTVDWSYTHIGMQLNIVNDDGYNFLVNADCFTQKGTIMPMLRPYKQAGGI